MPLTGFVCQANVHDGNGDLLDNVYSRIYSSPGWVLRTLAQGPPGDRDFISVATDPEAMSEPDKWAISLGYKLGAYSCPESGSSARV